MFERPDDSGTLRLRRRSIGRVLTLLLTLGATLLTVLGQPGAASAHTGFESSTPADAAMVDEPVSVVTIAFTGTATPVGDEFVALTPEGVVQAPVSIETTDDQLFTIVFDPPLAGGQVGIRWNVQAADSHPIEGAFSFTVNAPAPTTAAPTTVPPTTEAAATNEPAAQPATPEPATPEPASTEAAAAPASTEPAATDATVTDPSDAAGSDAAGTPGEPTAAPTVSLDEFLAVDNSTPGETTATVGRLVGFLGVALGLGAFAFVATAMRGRRNEFRHAFIAIRVFGVAIAVGAAIEYVGVARIADEAITSNWSTAPGFATTLRIVGGVGLAIGVAGTLTRGRTQRVVRRPSTARSLSAAVVADEVDAGQSAALDHQAMLRWNPTTRSALALAASVLIIVSFWFDGHTVSKGFRPLHALVNSVHVAAGAVWVGGVVMMATIIWMRYRSREPMRVVELVVRFSKVATIALVAVVAAGAVMAVLVLDSFGELTGTPWGQTLLLKTAAVGLAVIGGAYNHFRMLPALEAEPESPELLARLRSTIIAEAIVLVFVVAVTAWLVAAAS